MLGFGLFLDDGSRLTLHSSTSDTDAFGTACESAFISPADVATRQAPTNQREKETPPKLFPSPRVRHAVSSEKSLCLPDGAGSESLLWVDENSEEHPQR